MKDSYMFSMDNPEFPGLTRLQALLLRTCGVKSLGELASHQPEKLWRWMQEVNTETRILRRMPAPAMVDTWVDRARGAGLG